MKAIYEATGQDLQWKRAKRWKDGLELRSGEELLARLSTEKRTGRTIAEAIDGRWAFKRQSFWRANIVITELASQATIAIVDRRQGTSVVFSDARVLVWKNMHFLSPDWDWVDSNGRPLIHFHVQHGKNVVLEPGAFSLSELSLLTILGWHLMVLQHDAASDAGIVAACIIGSVVGSFGGTIVITLTLGVIIGIVAKIVAEHMQGYLSIVRLDNVAGFVGGVITGTVISDVLFLHIPLVNNFFIGFGVFLLALVLIITLDSLRITCSYFLSKHSHS